MEVSKSVSGVFDKVKKLPPWIIWVVGGVVILTIFFRKTQKPVEETTQANQVFSEAYYINMAKIQAEKEVSLAEIEEKYKEVQKQYDTLYAIEQLKYQLGKEQLDVYRTQVWLNFASDLAGLIAGYYYRKMELGYDNTEKATDVWDWGEEVDRRMQEFENWLNEGNYGLELPDTVGFNYQLPVV